jgi:translation initiation factor IF-1
VQGRRRRFDPSELGRRQPRAHRVATADPSPLGPTVSGDMIEMPGLVVDVSRGGHFTVECKLGSLKRTVIARCSGRLIIHRIRVLIGDEVTVEVSPYDPSRGRITYRRGERAP